MAIFALAGWIRLNRRRQIPLGQVPLPCCLFAGITRGNREDGHLQIQACLKLPVINESKQNRNTYGVHQRTNF